MHNISMGILHCIGLAEDTRDGIVIAENSPNCVVTTKRTQGRTHPRSLMDSPGAGKDTMPGSLTDTPTVTDYTTPYRQRHKIN